MSVSANEAQRSLKPRYAWASITEGTCNVGNFLIEWYLRRALAFLNNEDRVTYAGVDGVEGEDIPTG